MSNEFDIIGNFITEKPVFSVGSLDCLGVKTITPENALDILNKHNTGNRTQRKSQVTSYSRDIAMDRWEYTPDGRSITINDEGNLRDGQHRLKAIVDTGKSLDMIVYRINDKRGTLKLPIDTGLTRSTAVITGMQNSTVAIYKTAIRHITKNNKPSLAVFEAFLSKLTDDEKDFVVELASKNCELNAGAKSGLLMAYLMGNKTGAKNFWYRWNDSNDIEMLNFRLRYVQERKNQKDYGGMGQQKAAVFFYGQAMDKSARKSKSTEFFEETKELFGTLNDRFQL